MSEQTTDIIIIVEQVNIESFEIMKQTNKIQRERCHKHMSIGHTQCYCGLNLPRASDEVQKQILKNVIQDFELLTTSAFNTKKGPSRGHEYGTSREAQKHGKANDALTSANKKRYCTILERSKDDKTYLERVTEQGLNEDDIRKRDEEAKIDRVHCTNAPEKQV